jgi:hypothetical protein
LTRGPGDGDTLLLAAGQLGRQVAQAAGQAHHGQRLLRARLPFGRPSVLRDQGRGYVLGRGQGGDEVEGLEDEADGVGPDPGEGGFPQRA